MAFIRTCDRCHKQSDSERTAMERAEGWSGLQLAVREKSRSANSRLTTNKYQHELCADCTADLRKWLGE